MNPIPFAHNARTICIAFVSFAVRYINGNINDEKLRIFFAHCLENRAYDDYLYGIFSDIRGVDNLLPKELFNNKDNYEKIISKLFDIIIESGFRYYLTVKSSDNSINETNFLKNDLNYYAILRSDWLDISRKIKDIFNEIDLI